MPRFERSELVARFQDMKRRGEPIVGGGAGTGLSAKCEEAGGIDLIVIYNSGRYRMAGRGSLAGMMAYGNANDIVMEMAREVLPVVRRTPVLAGGQRHRPLLPLRALPGRGEGGGVLRGAELPDRRPHRRHVPGEPRGDRHGLRPRSGHDPPRPREGPPHHPLRLQRGRGGGDGGGGGGHRRLPPRPHHRGRDRRRGGVLPRGLPGPRRRVGTGRARGEPGRHPPRARGGRCRARRTRSTCSTAPSTATASTAPPRWSGCRRRSRSPSRPGRSRKLRPESTGSADWSGTVSRERGLPSPR